MKLWKKGLALLMVLSITAGMVMTGSAEAGLVPIDSASFPDPAFLRWVQEKDTDGDGALSQAERKRLPGWTFGSWGFRIKRPGVV